MGDKGNECYNHLITINTDGMANSFGPGEPAQILHKLGLDEVERLHKKILALDANANRITIQQVLSFLANDLSNRFENADEVAAIATNANARGNSEKLRTVFRKLPRVGFDIKTNDKKTPLQGVYSVGRVANAQVEKGSFGMGIMAPTETSKAPFESVVFHETLPGHHMQQTLDRETSKEAKPAYLDTLNSTAFVEGWALYAEVLASEIGQDEQNPYGLYSDKTQMMGMLSAQIFRAARLVVDTGIHSLGWNRERALKYMEENTLEGATRDSNAAPGSSSTHPYVETEIDRYLASPGQALSYYVGERVILGLREQVKQLAACQEDPNESLKKFHDVVLGSGTVTLPVLFHNVHAAFYITDKGPLPVPATP